MSINKKVTLTSIAQNLHLSATTVSRALRGHASVKLGTRLHIIKVAGELGYLKDVDTTKNPGKTQMANQVVTMRDLANHLNVTTSTVSRALNQSGKVSPKTIKKVLETARLMGFVINENARNLVSRNKKTGNKTTIYEIARQLGVSASTVSRAFSGSTSISENTRKAVLAKAAELKFKPNPYAVILKKQSAPIVGVLTPSIIHPLVIEFLSGIEHVAEQKHAHVMVMNFEFGQPFNTGALNAFKNITSGIVYMPFLSKLINLNEHNFKGAFVTAGTFNGGNRHPGVHLAQFDVVYKATAMLLAQGCRHIVLIDSASKANHARRIAGFKKAHYEMNLTPQTGQDILIPAGQLTINLPDLLKRPEINTDALIVIDRTLDETDIRNLEFMNIKATNISTIEMEAGSCTFLNSTAINHFFCPYRQLGKTSAELLFKKLQYPPEDMNTSVELSFEMMPAKQVVNSVSFK